MKHLEMNKYSLDEIDEEIIRILTDDARLSAGDVSKRMSGQTRQGVNARIRAMEEAGIIEGYSVVVNWDCVEKEG